MSIYFKQNTTDFDDAGFDEEMFFSEPSAPRDGFGSEDISSHSSEEQIQPEKAKSDSVLYTGAAATLSNSDSDVVMIAPAKAPVARMFDEPGDNAKRPKARYIAPVRPEPPKMLDVNFQHPDSRVRIAVGEYVKLYNAHVISFDEFDAVKNKIVRAAAQKKII